MADTRIHGTTKQQVGKVFEQVERAALLPLPPERFPQLSRSAAEGQSRRSRRSGQSVLSAPPEYLGRERVGSLGRPAGANLQSPLGAGGRARAARARPVQHAGRTSAPEKISGLERGAAYLLKQGEWIGPQTHQWAQAMLTRGASRARACCKDC